MTTMEPIHTTAARVFRLLSLAAALVLVSAGAAGCRDDGIGARYDDAHGVQIDASSAGIILRNSTPETVYYFAIERETSARVDWFPRCDSSNAVRYGQALMVPYTKIGGYKPQCEILLYLWNGTEKPQSVVRSGSMRSLTVTTP